MADELTFRIHRQNGFHVYRQGKQSFSLMKKGQKAVAKKEIKEFMDYMGVSEFTVGPQNTKSETEVKDTRRYVNYIRDRKSKELTFPQIIH